MMVTIQTETYLKTIKQIAKKSTCKCRWHLITIQKWCVLMTFALYFAIYFSHYLLKRNLIPICKSLPGARVTIKMKKIGQHNEFICLLCTNCSGFLLQNKLAYVFEIMRNFFYVFTMNNCSIIAEKLCNCGCGNGKSDAQKRYIRCRHKIV